MAVNDEQRLQALRERIDALDEQIQQLISERARSAQEIGRYKQGNGEGVDQFYRAEREAQVLRKVVARNQGPLESEEMARLFREIMSACLALESPLKIAFLGPEGTFTQAAALKHFGHSVRTTPLAAINEIFREVEAGIAHYGVVPVENSTEGVVTHTLDMFLSSPLKICGEVELRIHHHLLSNAENLAAVTRIVSHQQSLAQCRGWLDAHLPGIERVAVTSNAEAARLAAADSGLAAIAGSAAGEIYRLKVLAHNLEDQPNNTTRFLVIGKRETLPSGDDKTSLLLSTANRPGALHGLLNVFASRGISMTRIESRPSRTGLWEYVFFLDIEGHAHDEHIRAALEDLARDATLVKILGAYPKAVL